MVTVSSIFNPKPLCYLCDLVNGYAFKPNDWSSYGMPIIRIQNLNGSPDYNYYSRPPIERYVIEQGTLLFSWSGNRGTSFGPYLWYGPQGLLNQHIFKVIPKAGVHLKWLYHALDLTREMAERQAHGGSGLVHVRRGELLGYEIPTPGLDQQIQIASVLGTADDSIAKTEALIAKLKAIKQGLLHDLLTYGLDENGQIREPIAHPEQFKDSSLGRIPKTWQVSSMGSCLSVLYRYPSYYGIEYVDSGVCEVRGELISEQGQLSQNPSEYRLISEKTAQRFSRVRLETNDFVMSVRGTMGKIGIVPSWLTGAVITANLIRIQFNPSKVSARWALHWLTSFLFQKELDLFSSGTTIKTIQVPLISAIRFRRPPVKEQNVIASCLDAQDERIAAEEEYLSKLRAIKKGLMQDLLTGRVRVQFDKTVA